MPDLSTSGHRYTRKLILWAAFYAVTLGGLLFGVICFMFVRLLDREAIHNAARKGDVIEAKKILDAHPEYVNLRNRLELTPLHEAAWNGQPGVLELLIQRGADVHAKWHLARTGDGDWNALHITAIQGQTEAARVLIRAGVDVNGLTVLGETPLDVAVRNENNKLIEVLRSHGGVSSFELGE